MNKKLSSAQVIAQNIKVLMAADDLSQAALGRKAGVAQTLLSGLLSREDGIKNPQSSTLDKIADAFGIEPWKLLVPDADADFLKGKSIETLVENFASCGTEGRSAILRTAENEVRYQAGRSKGPKASSAA